MLRRLFLNACAAGTLVGAVALGAGTASAQGTDQALGRQIHAELNAERAARGLPALRFDGGVAASSAAFAQRLQGAGRLSHSGSAQAEIVGTGDRTGQVTDAWMRSADHRRFVVDPNLASVGVGVSCDRAGRMWVVAQFTRTDPQRLAPRSSSASPRAVRAGSGGTCGQPSRATSVSSVGVGGAEGLVRRLYAAYLNRPADEQGLATYTGLLAAGHDSAAIGRMLAASPEFADRHGSLSDRQFVVNAYRKVLGREPERGGVQHWLGVLRREGRAAVLHGFAVSDELRLRTGWV